MKILLQAPTNLSTTVIDDYNRAFTEAEELYLVSAFLRDWGNEIKLNKRCKDLVIVIGTDFYITTPLACKKFLNWLPNNRKHTLFAFNPNSQFHPKMMIWKSRKSGIAKYQAIIGSSNLTYAGLHSNYEANVVLDIDQRKYNKIKTWIISLKEESNVCQITQKWLSDYKARYRDFHKKSQNDQIRSNQAPISEALRILPITSFPGIRVSIQQRRQQIKLFRKGNFVQLVNECADGRLHNKDFYEGLFNVIPPEAWFQTKIWTLKGKDSNWRQICKSLRNIIESSKSDRDNKVLEEIDFLAKNANPNRQAWLTEILCHLYPKVYPIWNGQITKWLSHHKFRSPNNISQGSKYIVISQILRKSLAEYNKSSRIKIENLAEVDHVIWAYNQYLNDTDS